MELDDFYKSVDKDLCNLITLVANYKTKDSKANYFKTNGVLVRLGILRRSFELFITSLSKLPNNDYECESVNIMLNSIYLHLRGILDNTAWLIFYEIDLQDLQIPRDIDFAGKHFQKALSICPDLLTIVNKKLSWMSELKEKRDPIAHRLPLYIPPKFIDNEEGLQKAFALKNRANEKLNKNDTSWIDDELKAMSIGKYKPLIMNIDVEKGVCKTYQILPEMKNDMDNFFSFMSNIFNLLKDQKTKLESQ